MREIKFRGKRIDNGEWVYGYYVFEQLTEEHNILENVDNPYDNLNWYEVDPNTVGQCTGLEDDNDIGIYEGDYLNSTRKGYLGNDLSYESDVVKFERGAFRIRGILNYRTS